MLRKHCVIGFLFLCSASSVSYASGDFGCPAPRGALLFRTYDKCNSVPFLSPGNDSRLNLELLLIDAGKLTGTMSLPQEGTIRSDTAWLVVPFDFEDWQVHETGSAADNSSASWAADSRDYAQGEGSRCNSDVAGLGAFEDAVNAAAGLPKEDAAILVAARGALDAKCDAATPPAFRPPEGLRSALGRDFAVYIAGASGFYAGDFAAALKSFTSLKNSADPWLKETARYMVGRTLLNAAQNGAFGEWGEMNADKVDKGNLKDADEAFNAYLHDYPQGTCAASARGLLRRVYWLGGDRTRLAEAFDRALADPNPKANHVTVLDLVWEADTKLMNSVMADQIQSPQMLAVLDLMRMRSSDQPPPGTATRAPFTVDYLEGQRGRFAKNPALYNYLVAVYHVCIDDKPDQALALLPKLQNTPLNYFAFSQQTLRVLAMDAANQVDAERKLLLEMLPLAKQPLQNEQLQLALARLEVRTGHAERIFASGSPVKDKAIRTLVVEYIAGDDLLRQRIKDPKEDASVAAAALYSLLYKELTGGRYPAFRSDLELVPANPSEMLAPFVAPARTTGSGYNCPALREVAAALEHDPSDAKGLNCLGELVRVHGVHYGQATVPPKTDLGGSDSLLAATDYSIMDGYLKVIAAKQAPADARAYALFRAVRCCATAGYNHCGKQDIPQSVRKQWFDTLHKEYPTSVWTRSSKYYW